MSQELKGVSEAGAVERGGVFFSMERKARGAGAGGESVCGWRNGLETGGAGAELARGKQRRYVPGGWGVGSRGEARRAQ